MNIRQKKIKTYMMLLHQYDFDFIYSEVDSQTIPHYYFGDSKNVRVPTRYNGSSILSIPPGCFGSNQFIESVSIADGVSAIY